MLRYLRYCLSALAIIIALLGALFGYYVYAPEPAQPALSGTLTKASIQWDGLKRTYRTYLPKGLGKGAPVVVVLHGSGQNGAQIRVETGYGFERLADQYGFALVFPDAYTFDWNDCSVAGDYTANGKNVDDVGFLSALVDTLASEIGADRSRVFATGVSAGGFMSLRLALEAPSRFRAIAAVSANVPASENFKCKPTGQGTSVMIMNGTSDPLVPYAGGEVSLLGLFYKGGSVRSSLQSAQYFVDLNQITGAPVSARRLASDGVAVDRQLWRKDAKVEVELVAIQGGGHGMPQPYYRRARLLGPSPMAPNGPEIIWAFFDRQPR